MKRSVSLIVRLFPEERELLRLNAGLQGLSVFDYIRQNNRGFRLRKTPQEKMRLRELPRIGVNLNRLACWGKTPGRDERAAAPGHDSPGQVRYRKAGAETRIAVTGNKKFLKISAPAID